MRAQACEPRAGCALSNGQFASFPALNIAPTWNGYKPSACADASSGSLKIRQLRGLDPQFGLGPGIVSLQYPEWATAYAPALAASPSRGTGVEPVPGWWNADTTSLNLVDPLGSCRFKSGSGHTQATGSACKGRSRPRIAGGATTVEDTLNLWRHQLGDVPESVWRRTELRAQVDVAQESEASQRLRQLCHRVPTAAVPGEAGPALEPHHSFAGATRGAGTTGMRRPCVMVASAVSWPPRIARGVRGNHVLEGLWRGEWREAAWVCWCARFTCTATEAVS
jgi:hypothetical protein